MEKQLEAPKLLERGLTVEEARRLFVYEPATGDIIRRSTGRVTGSVRPHGYKQLSVGGKIFAAHRLAWALQYGTWPSGDIDHIDGEPGNNRIMNLRDIPHAENQRNLKRARNSSTGVTGVYVHTQTKRFVARIKVNGITRTLGSFGSLEEAASARAKANIDFGFSSRHGEAR